MAYYYSASERAFFSSEFMTVGEMPSDKVAVADDAWKRLIADQSSGRIIRSASNRSPESAAQTLPALTGYYVPGTVSISGAIDVAGAATMKRTLNVAGKTTLKDVSAAGISGATVTTTGNATIGGALTASGAATLKGTLIVAGKSTLKDVEAINANISNDAVVDGSLTVKGKSTLKALSATDIDAATLDTTGNATIGGTLTVGASAVVGGKNVVRTVNGFSANASGDVTVTVPSYEQDGVKIIGNPDYNTLTKPGFYHCELTGAKNGPGYVAKVIVFGEKTARHVTQVAFPIYNATSTILCPMMRSRNTSGTWEAWQKILLAKSDESVRAKEFSATNGLCVLDLPKIVKGTTPESDVFRQLLFRDSTGGTAHTRTNVLAAVEAAIRKNGRTDVKLYACKNAAETDERAQLLVGWKESGSAWIPYATAPVTPPGANGTEVVTAGWGNDQWLRVDGTSIMKGTLLSSLQAVTWVAAANGRTVINTTATNGAFVPLWQYEATTEGSFVLGGYKNAIQISFVSKENKASNTNSAEWALTITDDGSLGIPNDLSLGGILKMRGLAYRNVAFLEDAETEVGGQDDFVLAGGNQATYICSGESGFKTDQAKAFRRSLKRSAKDLIFASDNTIVFATNCQTLSDNNVRKVAIDTTGNIRFPARLYPDLEGGIWSESPYTLRHGRIARNTIPTNDESMYIPFYGKDGVSNAKDRLAVILFGKYKNGSAQLSMLVNNPANTTTEEHAGIRTRWRKVGEEYVPEIFTTHHPVESSNDYSVPTTRWVNDKGFARAQEALTRTGKVIMLSGKTDASVTVPHNGFVFMPEAGNKLKNLKLNGLEIGLGGFFYVKKGDVLSYTNYDYENQIFSLYPTK